MLLLLIPEYLGIEPPDQTVTIGDLFEVFWGVVDSPKHGYVGPNGEVVLLIRLSSLDGSQEKNIKNIEDLQKKETTLQLKRKKENKKNATTFYTPLKDQKLFLKKDDLLVPIKGKTEIVKIQPDIENYSVALVPSQHFLVLRKRRLHSHIYTPYLLLITKLLLEKIGNDRYNERINEVDGKYGLFNTFTKKEIESLKINIHSEIKKQKAIFSRNSQLLNKIQPLKEALNNWNETILLEITGALHK